MWDCSIIRLLVCLLVLLFTFNKKDFFKKRRDVFEFCYVLCVMHKQLTKELFTGG